MIHYHGGHLGPGFILEPRIGLLYGRGTYAYLPFDCHLTGLALYLSVPQSLFASATLRVLQNGSLIGDPVMLSAGSVALLDLDEDNALALPGVTASNLDDAARLSLELNPLTVLGTGPANFINVRSTIEFVPDNPALAGAEVWTLYSTGESTGASYPSLWALGGGGPFYPDWDYGMTGFANGYMVLGTSAPVCGTIASYFEQGEEPGVGFYAGAATPLARAGTFSHFQVISADPGSFDGVYHVALRKNGHDVLAVNTTAGGARIVASPDTAFMEQGAMWNWAVTASSGTRLTGHILCAFTPSTGGAGAGFGYQGFGARGLGG